MRRRNARLLGLILLILAIGPASGAARAGTARQAALGGDGGYLPDASDVLRWPASLIDHPDRLVLELGDPLSGREDALADQARLGHGGGAHVRLDADGRWGTAAFHLQDHLEKAPYEGSFTALWARTFGAVDLGLSGRFTTYGRSARGSDVGDRIDTRYLHQYGVGLRGEPRDGLRVDCGAELVNSRIESSGALWRLDADDWTSFAWRARAFWTLSPEATLVPLIDHVRDQRSLVSTILDGPADRDARMTSFGLGVRLDRGPDTTVLISCEYRTGSEDLRLRLDPDLVPDWAVSDRTFFQIRGRALVETAPRPWLVLRGAVRYVRIRDDVVRTAPAGYPEPGGRDLQDRFVGGVVPLSLGAGLRFGDLEIDLAWNDTRPVNPGLAGEGLYLGEAEDGYSALTLIWQF